LPSRVTADLAESRADIGVLIKGGVAALKDVAPQISQRLAPLRDLPAAVEVMSAADAAARGDAAAAERVTAQIAHAFGASVPVAAVASAVKSAEERLTELKQLYEKGLIDAKEYEERRRRVLDKEVGP
jgi:hypothetical protein